MSKPFNITWQPDAKWQIGGPPVLGYTNRGGKRVEIRVEMPKSREDAYYGVTTRVIKETA